MEIEQPNQLINQLKERIAHAASIQEKINAMNDLAWQLRIWDPERAFTLSTEALELSKNNVPAYEHGVAKNLVTLSFLDGEKGKLEDSLSRSLEALSYLNGQPEPDILIGAWYTLGWANYYLSDYPVSLEYGLKSLNLARDAGLIEWEGWCLDLVASTYKDHAQALQMYKDAYGIFEKNADVVGQSRILNNWAYTLMEAKEYVAALELAKKSQQLAKDAGIKQDMVNVAATIGEIHTALGDYEQSQSGLQDATLLFDQYPHDVSSVYIQVDLGEVYLKKNNLERAEQELLKALEIAQKMEMRNEQARCHQALSEVYERQGRFEQALEQHKKFHDMRESIVGETALKQLAALRVSHQIETAQRDANIHRLQKEKLQNELNEQKRIYAILEEIATRDPLTNLFNRRHFLHLAEQEWKRAMRYQHPISALMLDVDQFKQINDQYGHAYGDKALSTIAHALRATLRSSEIAGRYGGDEFVVLLPETLAQNGIQVAERLLQTVKEYTLSSDREKAIELSLSIGIACAIYGTDEAPRTLDELLNRADQALYHAKRAGKGKFHIYSD